MAFDISAVMEKQGKQIIESLLCDIEEFYQSINDSTQFKILSKDNFKSGDLDKTRLVINTKNNGLSGFNIEKILRKQYNIQVEMADLYNIVCITTNANRGQDLKELRNALIDIDENYNKCLPLPDICIEREYTTARS